MLHRSDFLFSFQHKTLTLCFRKIIFCMKWMVCGIALMFLSLLGCNHSSKTSDRSIAVKLIKVKPKKLQTVIAVFGQTEPLAQATLAFQVSGIVEKVRVNEGDPSKERTSTGIVR